MDKNYEFWNYKLPTGFYDKLFSDGKEKNIGLQSTWHDLTFLKVKKFIKNNDNHLDYACGPGTFIGNYLECNSIGYDIAINQIEYANSKYSDKNKYFTTSKKEILLKEPFDVITVMALIEVLSNDDFKSEMEFLLSILKPGGKIIFTTPNYGGLMMFVEKISNVFNTVNYSEVKLSNYSKRKIKRFMDINFDSYELNYKTKCILNIGILFSILNKDLAIKIENFIEKLFNNFFGFLLMIEITKK